jgi:16S rRNA (adenine1518-N6/adenine1519-N6)-dimethyltransferase
VGDYLKWDSSQWQEPYAIIGNFPYNISSQIFFKILETPTMVAQVVCMLQREVAQRLTSGPGSKRYGILSVLLQAYFRLEYLFEVGPEQFHPPPKVHSAVIRLTSLQKEDIGCNPKHLKKLVKQAFQNRRKTLRNALKPFNLPAELVELPLLDRRAEQLTVAEFVSLTNKITPFWNP